MNEVEKRQQLIIAKANLRIAQRSFDDSTIRKEELEHIQRIYEDLRDYDPNSVIEKPVKLEKAAFEVPKAAMEELTSFTPETKTLLEKLIAEKDKVSAEKGMLCNKIHLVPVTQDCPELVTEILNLRNRWKDLNAKVRFVQQHGCLPESTTSPQEAKGIDESKLKSEYEIKELWALKEDIENCSSNLSKAKKRLSTSQDLAKQAHYQRKIVELEWKLSMMRTVYNSRK